LTRNATTALAERGFGLSEVDVRSLDQLRKATAAAREAIGDVE
jgi:hypothetical protein